MFKVKETRNKKSASYKSLYLNDYLIKQIEKIAYDNNTSFNNVIISIIEYCLNNDKNQK